MNMTFYSLNSSGPCKAIVEYRGNYFDVRSGWGEREGWTNNPVATLLTDEEMHSPAYDGEEMSEREVHDTFSDETLEGIEEAIKKASN